MEKIVKNDLPEKSENRQLEIIAKAIADTIDIEFEFKNGKVLEQFGKILEKVNQLTKALD
jgi:hypothetical protein